MVNIFGETRITGGFTVSALNSAINALSAAGGPTEIGSVRSIQLIRGSSRKTIDLYKFMSDPTVQFGFDLQNNDIIFVPVLKTLVSIEGAVNRPMDYELLPNETLNDLIKYAGGLKMNVFPDFVQIRRFVNGEERLLEFKLNEVVSGKIAVPLMNGDDVRIRSINKPLDQYVEISGSVYYPGRFDLSSNKSLLALLNNAQPDFYAKTDVVFVERVRPDETVEVLTVPYPGYNGAPDFDLRERDKVRILSQSDYRDVANISVSGFVRVPFEKTFSLNDRLTVNQAIELAGGLKTGAYPIAYILRRNLLNPVELQYIRIELASEGEKLLQPGDQLITFSNTTFTNLGEISVQGSVRNPFSRTFAATDRLNVKQAIEIAGGIEPTAYPVAYIFRRNLFNPEEVKYIRIELEEAEQIQLQPGDQLNIYDNTLFTNIGEVRVSGAVKNPRSFTYDATLSLHDVLTNAGGLNVGAAFNRV
jgi:protein involved in polysaccharide export with SLBB domain